MAAAFSAALMALMAIAFAPAANGAKTSQGVVHETFDAFAKRHDRSYAPGSDEYAMRQNLFELRRAEVIDHNSGPEESYEVTLNHFADLTDQERSMYLGLRPTIKKAPKAASLLETTVSRMKTVNAPDEVDWTNLTVAKGMWQEGLSRIPDQGSCGSCWAVATASMMEAHYEISRGSTNARHFSAQDLVNCVPNPRSCGGDGGCKGATVELAMEYIKQNGLDDETRTPYTASTDKCQKAVVLAEGLGGGLGGVGLVSGHTTLASNQAQPLKEAMFLHGPVALSVAAGNWFSYNKGVFDGCPKAQEMIINHAVLGYGYTPGFWKIRNSWGPDWGEDGFISLKRVVNEDQYCSVDNHPEEGIGCKGGPSRVNVCGMCGMLFDSVYPHFASVLAQEQDRTVSIDSGGALHEEQGVSVDDAEEVLVRKSNLPSADLE